LREGNALLMCEEIRHTRLSFAAVAAAELIQLIDDIM
jgi:hypothetical protein